MWDKIKENILTVARQDGKSVIVWVEQEPASGGKNQVAELKNYLAKEGFTVKGHNPKDDGDRVTAANTWFGEAATGKWSMVKGLWNEKFLSQLDMFPEGGHDDRVTSVTGARHSIAPIRKWSRTKFMHLNQNMTDAEREKVAEAKANKALDDAAKSQVPSFLSLHPAPTQKPTVDNSKQG